MTGFWLLYTGGALAVALALCAVARQPRAKPAVRKTGRVRALRYGIMLSALWLPVLLYFTLRPAAVNKRRPTRRK